MVAMRRILKLVAILAAIVVVVAGVSLFSIYEASQQVPEFYREAIAVEPAGQQPARDAFVAQATALASDLHRAGHWQTLFTADQINAWLALELEPHYPGLLPEGLRDPRIMIGDKLATVACRITRGDMSAVLSISVEVSLPEPNVMALRIRSVRAGAVPVPLAQVLDAISHAARALNLRLEWRKAHGDPVALVTFPRPGANSSEPLSLQAVELRDGELFVSGTIGVQPSIAKADKKSDSPPPAVAPAAAEPVAGETTTEASTSAETADAAEPADDQPVVGAAEKETRQK